MARPVILSDERLVATDAIREWNDEFAESEKTVLLPVRWETHAVPRTGIRPQEVINRQLVDSCDFLIAIFWTRIGTRTGVAEGGTVEEINEFVSARKPALLYFSSRPIDPNKVDLRQYKRLTEFKKAMDQKALAGSFSDLDELRQKLRRDLFRQVRELKSGSKLTQEDKGVKLDTVSEQESTPPLDEEPESETTQAPSERELLEIGAQRRIASLLEILRNVRSFWKEQLVPSNRGSFRYWAQMQDGSRRVICGFNVAGGRFDSDAGTLDVWICYEPAIELGGYHNKEDLCARFNDFKKSKYSKSRFWLALSGVAEAEKLYAFLSGWIQKISQ